MDLVGQDVNEAVTRSVWAAFGYDSRFAPSLLQRSMVEAGWLGRKSGRGWYRYDDEAPPPAPDPEPGHPVPAYVTTTGDSPLLPLLERSGVEIREDSGERLLRRQGRGASRSPCGVRRPAHFSSGITTSPFGILAKTLAGTPKLVASRRSGLEASQAVMEID